MPYISNPNNGNSANNSAAASATTAPTKPRFLVWGNNGWIGGLMIDLLRAQGHEVHSTGLRMEYRDKVEDKLADIRPTHVLNCAGVTGRPNVDWCEDNKQATFRSNVIGTANLIDCCWQRGIHCTVFATGCIYEYDQEHQMGGRPFKEEDKANFEGSYYSRSKARIEDLLMEPYINNGNTLILRLRMPVSDDGHSRSFVTKIANYKRIVDIPNSQTILHDLLPCAIVLAQNNETGLFNFTNPGAISHVDIMTMYRDIVEPSKTWETFTEAEQAKILKAGRSNCELDSSKLVKTMRKYGMEVPEVHAAYRKCFERMRASGFSVSR